jgi:hypothetical protein
MDTPLNRVNAVMSTFGRFPVRSSVFALLVHRRGPFFLENFVVNDVLLKLPHPQFVFTSQLSGLRPQPSAFSSGFSLKKLMADG